MCRDGVLCQVCHRVAMLHASVSLIQVLKSCGPFFAASLSFVWNRERLPTIAYMALVPIVGGVLISARSQMNNKRSAGDGDALGLASALVSCGFLALGSVGSKRLMSSSGGTIDSTAVWLMMNTWSCLFIAPLVGYEVMSIWRFMSTANFGWARVVLLLMVDALCVSMSFRISMFILENISPTTHSVLTLCKRIVVIVTASLYFGSHMPLQAALGIAISTAGTLWHAQALSPKQGTESRAARDKSPSLHGRALSFEMTSFTKYFGKTPEENDTLECFDEEEATPTSSLRAASLAHNRSANFNLGE